jgi:NADH-quinone oxidoreductase subunit J
MTLHDAIFWFFSIAMLLCGVLVIVNRNPVTSAMFLILLFFFLAGLFVLLEAFFLAVIQILVYAGAVMVLFLFVIMLLDIKAAQRVKIRWIGLVGGLAVALAFLWELGIVLKKPLAPAAQNTAAATEAAAPSANLLFEKLFKDYMLPFEVASLILLVAMIGVVLLSKRETPEATESGGQKS